MQEGGEGWEEAESCGDEWSGEKSVISGPRDNNQRMDSEVKARHSGGVRRKNSGGGGRRQSQEEDQNEENFPHTETLQSSHSFLPTKN